MTGYDGGGPPPELDDRIRDASWAVAARDCAIEAGDLFAAADFADQARKAINRAVAAGIEPAELAIELDYPGGHTAMDGPHIEHQIAALRPSGAPDPLRRPALALSGEAPATTGWAGAAALTADDEVTGAARHEQLIRWNEDDLAEAHQDQADGWGR